MITSRLRAHQKMEYFFTRAVSFVIINTYFKKVVRSCLFVLVFIKENIN